MYTTKTTTQSNRKGIMSHPLGDKVLHQVLCADGEVLRNCESLGLAEKVAKELNEFEANQPACGDLQAEFIRIASQ